MSSMLYVLVFVVLYVRMAQCWDIAASSGDDLLSFYTNETLTSTISIESRNLSALTYDEVHNMMLYVDKKTNNDIICGYDLTSIENKCFTEGTGRNIHDLAFDPVTEQVFFTDTNDRSINWISLKPGSQNNVNLLLKMDDGIPGDIIVDSCKGYIYWLNTNLTKPTIERARFNGTDREVIETLKTVPVNSTYTLEPHSLAIEQYRQVLYWLEPVTTKEYRLFTRELKKKQKPIFVIHVYTPKFIKVPSNTLLISKTEIINLEYPFNINKVYSFPKTFATVQIKNVYSVKKMPITMAANYKIKDQIQGCEALSRVKLAAEYNGPFCVHGTKDNEESGCKCTPGYTGERCDATVCENYCLQGNCSFNDEGIPECSCEVGYSGERCEVNVCQGYCLNDGKCFLNEEDEPSCECSEGYEGIRCEVDTNATVSIVVNYHDKSSTCSCRQSQQPTIKVKGNT